MPHVYVKMSADEAADFAQRREDADEEEEQKRSVTPNFSFRSFFEKSDATENEKTKKKNAFQKFMAFEPESVTKDDRRTVWRILRKGRTYARQT